ncbi:zinc finger and BTB domain-containing protein 6-like [Labrus bergylta]|uniref:zinc finger and BTB domain-containing protein 6-like n=1 Tax=Labrus bergylta TaxID=56723 RepID=UPI0009B2ECA1|nr:zinc finger and BTB domain-containing protein 6-like [Labrus bergylta]
MSSCPDTLLFRFPAHTDSILSKINGLREAQHFCDVTLLLSGPPGATAQARYFHGHRVVLAASSDFLRDQFLLHEGQAELSVGVVSSVEVGWRLLLSCYTGLLKVPLRELVSYLTAASTLQMTQVVEKCAQAISTYLDPTLAFLKLDGHSEREREIQQQDCSHSGTHFKVKEERDAAQASTSNQEASTEECGIAVIQLKLRVSQGKKAEIEELCEVRDDKGANVDNEEFFEGASCYLETLELEEAGKIPLDQTNKPSYQADHIAGGSRCRPHFPTAVSTSISSTTTESSSQLEELLNNTSKQDKGEEEEDKREEKTAKPQECRDKADLHLTQDSDNPLVQRPYLCRRCDRVFQHLESYVGHLKEHRQYLCLVCRKVFSQKSNLTRHIQVHTGVKPFRCPLCHKTFSQKATLQDHFNLHTGNKPLKCHCCGVHCAHKLDLRRHLKGIHGKCSLQNLLEAVD